MKRLVVLVGLFFYVPLAFAESVFVDLYTDWSREEVAFVRVEVLDRTDYSRHWVNIVHFAGGAERGARITEFDNITDNRASYKAIVTLLDRQYRPVDGTIMLFLINPGVDRILSVRIAR